MLIKLGNSYKDCNGEDQFDFIVVLNNINNQKHKFLLMSTNSEAKSWVVFEEEFYGDYKGMRILSSSELKLFNRAAGIYFQNAAYINRSNGDNILAMKNGEVYTYYWNNIN